MPTSQINMKKGSISLTYFKRTAEILGKASGDYIKDAMPTTTSTISSMRDTMKPFSSTMSNISGSIIAKTRELKLQQGIRKINDWFLGMDREFAGSDEDSQISFDIPVDDIDNEKVLAQLSAEDRSSKQISKTIVESSHKMVEAQLSVTANMLTSMDKLGAAIASGFDNINATLNKILKVTTKNTSALIEATVASSGNNIRKEKMMTTGKFDFKAYKDMIGKNISESEFGMIMSLLPLLGNGMGKSMLTPETVANMGINALLKKTAPNLKQNMKALDDSINSMIMSSLIRIGEQRNKPGTVGMLGRIFGIDGDRKTISTDRSAIALKAIPYDTISKESITNAIPGYLRQILIQLGGPDMVYDYRTRSFRSKAAITRDFRQQAISFDSLKNSSSSVRKALIGNRNDQNYLNFTNMVYDLLLEDMSDSTQNAGNTLRSFKNKNDAKRYIEGLIKNAKIPRGNGKVVDQLAQAFTSLDSRAINDIKQQIVLNNMQRDVRLGKYKSDADNYEIDLSHIIDSIDANKDEILRRYTGGTRSSISISQGSLGSPTGGINYTNAALFEIYRRLNRGINVYQVGASNIQTKKFKGLGRLKPPSMYKTEADTTEEQGSGSSPMVSSLSGEDHTNILTDDTQTDANGNPLKGGQKFGKWASMSGKNIINALFRGNPEDVRRAFGKMVGDVSEVAAKPIKTFLTGDPASGKQGIFAKINDSFGNVTGYLKHKFMGTGYEYTDEKGQKVKVSTNEKGGVIGFLKDKVSNMFKGTTEKTKKWFMEVAKYFDFRSDKDKESGDVASKRKSILASSVGAMAGLGFLGGPFGLIFGALAGSALQAGGFGNKIKEMLFGKDYTDKKGNKKHKLGLIERAVNGIVDPIRYQIGKTFSTFGNVMKKNILGPLSDIGVAIKERMASAAGGVVSKTFGKIFGGMGWVIKKLINIPLSIARAPITLLGGLTRGGMQAAGGVAGAGLGAIANIIAGKEGREVLKQRRAARNEEIKSSKESSEYSGGYKAWKAAQDEKRRNNPKFSDYVAEQQEIIAEATNKTEENTAKISDEISTLTYHATHHDPVTDSSIYTSDVGLHERIDDMFEFLRRYLGSDKEGISKPASSISSSNFIDDSNEDSNALLGASIGISSHNGISKEDVEDISSIADESSSNKPNKRSILSRFKSLLKRNADDDQKSTSSITGEKDGGGGIKGLLSSIADIIPGWAIPLGGLVLSTMIPGINTFLWGDKSNGTKGAIPSLISALAEYAPEIGKAIGGSIKGILTGIFDKDGDGDVTESEAAKTSADINSGINDTITNPILGGASVAGANVTGSTDPAGLYGTVNNARRITSTVTNMGNKFNTLSKIPVVKNITKPAQFISGLSKIPGDVTSSVKNTVETAKNIKDLGFKGASAVAKSGGREAAENALVTGTTAIAKQGAKKGAVAAIKAGLQTVIKFLGSILGFILDGILMLFQGNEVYGEDKYDATVAQQVGLVVGGALGGTGGGFADGFQWADLIDIGGNALKWMGLGAAAGTVVPLLGNAVGAVVGFIIGLIFGMIGGKTIAKAVGNAFERVGNLINKGSGKGYGVTDVAGKVWNATTNAVKWTGKKIVNGIEYVGGIASKVWDKLKEAGKQVASFVGGLVGDALKIFNLIKNFKLSSGLDGLLELISNIANVVGGKGFGNVNLIQQNPFIRAQSLGQPVSQITGYGETRNIYYQKSYGSYLNMNQSGCGPIAASYLANLYGYNITPTQAAKILNGTPYRDSDGGTSSAGVAAIGSSLGIPMQTGPVDVQSISNKLSNGEPVVFLGKSDDPNSPYTSSGHFVVGENIDSSGNVTVMDPLSSTKKKYKAQNILNGLENVTFAETTGDVGYGKGRGSKRNISSINRKRSNKSVGSYGGGFTYANGEPMSNLQRAIVTTALSFIGRITNYSQDPQLRTSFLRGGNTSDCSAFVQGVYKLVTGVDIGGNTQSIYLNKTGYRINSIDQMKPGDVFLLKNTSTPGSKYDHKYKDGVSHTGIYIGNGEYVHVRSNKQHLGAQKGNVNDSYFIQHWLCAKRFIDGEKMNGRVVDTSNLSIDIPLSYSVSTTGSTGDSSSILGILQSLGTSVSSKFSELLLGGLAGTNSTSSITDPSLFIGTDANISSTFRSSGSDNAARAYNFFISKGLSPAAAAGIIGNLQQESGVDPTKRQYGGGPGRGIAQWEEGSGRYNNLLKFAAQRGTHWTDLDTQLEFLWYELQSKDIDGRMRGTIAPSNLQKLGISGLPGGFSAFKSLNNVNYATALFEGAFERAGRPMMENRYKYANQAYQRFANEASSVGYGNGPSSGSPSGIVYTPTVRSESNNSSGYGNISNSSRSGGYGLTAASTRLNYSTDSLDIVTSDPTDHYSPSIYHQNQGGSSDLFERVEQILSAALVELKSINNNTGRSTDVLSVMAKAVGSNNSTTAKAVNNRRRTLPTFSNNTNVSSVMSIVKPI